jgi:hypothetical protein
MAAIIVSIVFFAGIALAALSALVVAEQIRTNRGMRYLASIAFL